MKLIFSIFSLCVALYIGVPNNAVAAGFYGLNIDGYCKTNYGAGFTAVSTGQHAYNWVCQDSSGTKKSLNMQTACQQQVHSTAVAVLTGGGVSDWKCAKWSEFNNQIVPIVVIASDFTYDLNSIKTAVANTAKVVNDVRNWYGTRTIGNMTFTTSQPLVVFSPNDATFWNNLSCQTADIAERPNGCGNQQPKDRYILLRTAKSLVTPLFSSVIGKTLDVPIFVYTGANSNTPKFGAGGDVYNAANGAFIYYNVQPPTVAACDINVPYCGAYALGHEMGHNFTNVGHTCDDRNPKPDNCANSIMQTGNPPNAILVAEEQPAFQQSPFLQTPTSPTAPSTMSVSTTSNSVSISWNDNSSNEAGFNLYRWNGSSWTKISTLGANTTSYTDTGLTANQTYKYAVEAYNSAGTAWTTFGNGSISATTKSITATKPNAPSSMSVSTTSDSVNVSWSDNSTDEIGFNLYRWNGSNWINIATLGTNVTSYTNTGLSPNTTYYYAAEAYNAAGATWTTFGSGYISAITKAVAVTKPIAPSTMSVSTTSTSVNVSWSDNSTNELGFNLYKWSGSGWTNIATLGANVTSYTNTGLTPNTTYYYAVEAYNNGGTAWTTFGSSYISAITKAVSDTKPIAPSSMSVSTTTNSVSVFWNDNSSNEVGFNLYRWSGSTWTKIATLGINSTSYTDTGLASGVTYYYAVEAYNNIGAAWTTFGSGYISAITATLGKPNAPSSMSVSTTSNSANVSWSDNSTNESGFYLYRWNGSAWIKIVTLGANVTSYTNTGLTSKLTYYYAVEAYNSVGTAWTTFGSGYISALTK